MTHLREATPSEAAAWLEAWRARLESWYERLDVPSEWASEQITGRVAGYQGTSPVTMFAIDGADDAGQHVVGTIALSSTPDRAAIVSDIWVEPQYRRRGHAADALRHAASWAREQGLASVWAVTDPREPAHTALFAGYPVRAQHMIKRLVGPVHLADGLRWRPMTDDEFAVWRARSVEGYAAQIAESGSMTADDAAARSSEEFDRLLPDGMHTENQAFLCLCAGAEVVATNWIGHHRSAGTSWVWDVEVSEEHRGKGYGRAAMLAGEQITLDAGDTHLALNVFGQNTVAIGLYTAMGYQTADQARSLDL